MKFSAFAMFPSRKGSVVRSANKIVESFSVLGLFPNIRFTILAKRTIDIMEDAARNILNQIKFPASAATRYRTGGLLS